MNVLQRLNAVCNLILTGEAEMGGRVFYDQHTNRITGRAPDLAVTDLPLV